MPNPDLNNARLNHPPERAGIDRPNQPQARLTTEFIYQIRAKPILRQHERRCMPPEIRGRGASEGRLTRPGRGSIPIAETARGSGLVRHVFRSPARIPTVGLRNRHSCRAANEKRSAFRELRGSETANRVFATANRRQVGTRSRCPVGMPGAGPEPVPGLGPGAGHDDEGTPSIRPNLPAVCCNTRFFGKSGSNKYQVS